MLSINFVIMPFRSTCLYLTCVSVCIYMHVLWPLSWFFRRHSVISFMGECVNVTTCTMIPPKMSNTKIHTKRNNFDHYLCKNKIAHFDGGGDVTRIHRFALAFIERTHGQCEREKRLIIIKKNCSAIENLLIRLKWLHVLCAVLIIVS